MKNRFDLIYEQIKSSIEDADSSNQPVDNFKVKATFTKRKYLDGDWGYIKNAKEEDKQFSSLNEFFNAVKEKFGVGDIADLSWEIEGYGADISADMEQTIEEYEYTYENFIKYFNYCIENEDNSNMCVHESYLERGDKALYVSFYVSK